MKLNTKLFFFLLTATIISCSEDSSENDSQQYYMKAKINGVQKEFSDDFFGQYYANYPNGPIIYIGGTSNPSTAVPGFSILVEGNEQVTAKTYSHGPYTLFASYRASLEESLYYSDGLSQPRDFTLTVTKFTNVSVEGTFKGMLKNDSGETISITEGEFVIPWGN